MLKLFLFSHLLFFFNTLFLCYFLTCITNLSHSECIAVKLLVLSLEKLNVNFPASVKNTLIISTATNSCKHRPVGENYNGKTVSKNNWENTNEQVQQASHFEDRWDMNCVNWVIRQRNLTPRSWLSNTNTYSWKLVENENKYSRVFDLWEP